MSREYDNTRILIISDLHCPYEHPDTVKFLTALKNKFKPTRVISLGDEVDFHSMSFHTHDPDMLSPGEELKEAIKHLKPIYKLFPEVEVLESNHGSLIYRRAVENGIPRRVIRSYGDILQAPKGWVWHFDLSTELPTGELCYFHHSRGTNVLKNSQAMGMSFVQGHFHSKFEVNYWGNPVGLHFGMSCGCMADPKSMALAYCNTNMVRPVIGTSVILEGRPQLIPMILNKGGRWNGKI